MSARTSYKLEYHENDGDEWWNSFCDLYDWNPLLNPESRRLCRRTS